MAKKIPETPTDAPAPVDPFVHAGDPHWGQGGRYLIDPATGQRVPAPAEADPEPEPEPAQE